MTTHGTCTLLYRILESHAPRGEARRRLTQWYDETISAGLTPAQIEKALVEELYDGLTNGQWTWNTQFPNLVRIEVTR